MTEYLQNTYKFDHPEFVQTFDEVTLWASRFGAFLLDEIKLVPHIQGIDIGCATGFPLLELAQRHGTTTHFTGVDVWEEAVVHAQQKVEQWDVSNVEIVKGDAAVLPFEDGTVDLITANLVINNCARPEEVVKECGRVLKSGGRLVMTTNPAGHMREFYELYRDSLRELNLLEKYKARLEHEIERRGTVQSLTRLLELGGLTVERSVERSFTMQFLDGRALFTHRLIQIGFLDGWRAVVDPEDEVRVFEFLEQKLNDYARDSGRIVLTVPMLYLEGVKKESRSH